MPSENLIHQAIVNCLDSIDRVAAAYPEYYNHHHDYDYVVRMTEDVRTGPDFVLRVGEMVFAKMDEGPVCRGDKWANGHVWSVWSARAEEELSVERRSFEIMSPLIWEKKEMGHG